MLYRLSDFEIQAAIRLGMGRSASMGHLDTRNSRNFFGAAPPYWRHLVGAAGEYAYSGVTGLPVDTDTIGRGDRGDDFPDGTDVKTGCRRSRPRECLIPESVYRRKRPRRRYCWAYVIGLPVAGEDWREILRPVHLWGWVSIADFDRFKTGPWGERHGYRCPTLSMAAQHLTLVKTRDDLVSDESLF